MRPSHPFGGVSIVYLLLALCAIIAVSNGITCYTGGTIHNYVEKKDDCVACTITVDKFSKREENSILLTCNEEKRKHYEPKCNQYDAWSKLGTAEEKKKEAFTITKTCGESLCNDFNNIACGFTLSEADKAKLTLKSSSPVKDINYLLMSFTLICMSISKLFI